MVVLKRKALAEPRGKYSSHGNYLESSKLGESHDGGKSYTGLRYYIIGGGLL